jgi:hypothetical protein
VGTHFNPYTYAYSYTYAHSISHSRAQSDFHASPQAPASPEREKTGVKSEGRVAQIGLTGKKKVPKLGEMC